MSMILMLESFMNFAESGVLDNALILASSEGEAEVGLLAAPFAVAAAVWALIYRYYRNQDKTFHFEHETHIDVTEVHVQQDEFWHAHRGVSNSRVFADNSRNPRDRVQRMDPLPNFPTSVD